MIYIYVGELPNGPSNGPCGGAKAKVPPFHIFFIYQDKRLKFNMHVVHEKRNTAIRICVGRLFQESGRG